MSILVDFDTLAADLDGWVQRGTLRVWKHRQRLAPIACDLATHRELYDVTDANLLERDTRNERIRRMSLPYQR